MKQRGLAFDWKYAAAIALILAVAFMADAALQDAAAAATVQLVGYAAADNSIVTLQISNVRKYKVVVEIINGGRIPATDYSIDIHDEGGFAPQLSEAERLRNGRVEGRDLGNTTYMPITVSPGASFTESVDVKSRYSLLAGHKYIAVFSRKIWVDKYKITIRSNPVEVDGMK